MITLQSHSAGFSPLHPLLDANPEFWADIFGTLHKKTYTINERIFSHGDSAQCLWLVLSGWVKLTRQTPDGKESMLGLCTQGDAFGEAALFTNAMYRYTAEVLANSAELVAIPAATIRTLLVKEPTLSAQLMALLNDRMSQAQLKLEHMKTMTAAQRLGCFLLRLCHAQKSGEKTLQIPIEKHILATYLGMKPETLSRSQHQLKSLGICIVGSNITIDKIEALRVFVCGSCSESGNCDSEYAASDASAG